MKRLLFIPAILLVMAGGSYSCGLKKTEKDDIVTGDTVIKVLKDEPAYIGSVCYQYENRRVDTFALILLDKHPDFGNVLFPVDSIPVEYRIIGLYVKISGNVITEGHRLCYDPNTRVRPIYSFKLKTIKHN